MASSQIVDNFSNTIADTVEEMYINNTGSSVKISSVTAANNSSVNAQYSMYIKSSSGVQKAQIPNKIVIWGENDLGIGVVGQVIPVAGQLLVETSAINSIYFTISAIISSS